MINWLERNIPALSQEECRVLSEKNVFIAGCGGLGGYLAELSIRCGIGGAVLCDGDCFEISNMNRQLGCTAEALSRPKAAVLKERLLSINPNANITAHTQMLTPENAVDMLRGTHIILDGLDSGESRLALEEAAAALNLPIIHGAVNGWRAQITVVPPGSGILKKLYSPRKASPSRVSCLSFTPSFCASLQVSQAVKLLLNKPVSLSGKILFADLENFTFDTISI